MFCRRVMGPSLWHGQTMTHATTQAMTQSTPPSAEIDRQPATAPWLDCAGGVAPRCRRALVGLSAVTALGAVALAAALGWTAQALLEGHPPPAAALFLGSAALAARVGANEARQACAMTIQQAAQAALSGRLAQVIGANAGKPQAPAALADPSQVSLALEDHVDALARWARDVRPLRAQAGVSLLFLVGALAAVHWLVALLAVLVLPLLLVLILLVGSTIGRATDKKTAELHRLGHHLFDRISNLTSIRLLRAGEAQAAAVAAAAQRLRVDTMAVLRIAFLTSGVLDFFTSLGIALVAVFVGLSLLGLIAVAPALSPGEGVFLLLLIPEVFAPIREIMSAHHEGQAARAAASALPSWSLPLPEPQSAETAPPPPKLPLLLRDVIAWSPPSPLPVALAGPVSLTLPVTGCVLLWGASGSGKSSLLRALAGDLVWTGTPGPDDKGTSGHTIAAELQSAVAWSAQRPVILRASWRDNLRLADAQATDAALLAVLERVGLRALVEGLPEGLGSLLGRGGIGLSGGQAQRLALARALLSNRPVLLLDEPTAGLDAGSKARIASILETERQHRCLVIATHDPGLRPLADHLHTLVPRARERAPLMPPARETAP